MDSSINSWDRSISNRRGVGLHFFINNMFYRIVFVFIANIVDPVQTPHSVASDLGQRCLLMSLLQDAKHKKG